MRDNSCVHPTILTYLYGLRGHKENKFKVLTLTGEPEVICKKKVNQESVDLTGKQRHGKLIAKTESQVESRDSTNSLDEIYDEYDDQNEEEYNGENELSYFPSQ